MNEAAAAARDGAGSGMAGADALPNAAVDIAAGNASTMASIGTAPVTATWQPDEAADEDGFAADVDIGMPESDLSPGAAEKLVAALAVAPVPAGPAKAKGPSRRPTSTQAAPYHDALTSYRELFDKAKCGLACRSTLLPHMHTTVLPPAVLPCLADLQTPTSLCMSSKPCCCAVSPPVLCCGSRWHAGSMDDRVAARVTGAAFADMEPLAEELGPAFQPPTQVHTPYHR